jgi:quercetin dioxygenase-like cupin family protein
MRAFRRRPSSIPHLVALAIGLAILTAATAGLALATPGSGITTTILARGLFQDVDVNVHVDGYKVSVDTKGPTDVYVVSNVLVAGGHTGWHTHLGPSLITVTAGTITAYEGDDPTCSPTTYHVGEGFVDPGDGHIHIAAGARRRRSLQCAGRWSRIDVPSGTRLLSRFG